MAPFWGPNTSAASTNNGGDVAGDEQLDAAQTRRGVDRPERPEAAVGRRRPAETDDDAGRSAVEGAIDQLADAGGGGRHRVVAVGSTGEDEPARPRHLDDRRAAVQPPVGLDGVAERTGHDVATVGPAEHVEEPFAAVGQGDLLAVVSELPARVTDRGRDIGGRRGAPELVDRGHDPHSGDATGAAIPDRGGSISGMAVTVRIPTTLRPLSGGAKQIELESGSLADVIAALEATHPGFRDRLLDDDGGLRKFVNVFVDDDDVRYLDGLDTKVADGITVSIIPAVAGG